MNLYIHCLVVVIASLFMNFSYKSKNEDPKTKNTQAHSNQTNSPKIVSATESRRL
jgi:hypothetical protein